MDMDNELKEQIKEIPGKDGWWKEENGEVFITLGEKLLEKGFTNDEALDFLTTAFNMTADEFGN